jgi:hypothetical protein
MKTKNFIVVVISIIVLEMKGHVADSRKRGITKRFKKLKDNQSLPVTFFFFANQ